LVPPPQAAFLIGIVSLLWGCAAPSNDLDFAPLLRTAEHAEQNEFETEWLTPLWDARSSPSQRQWTLHPLCGYREREGLEEFDFLAPLGRYYRSGDRTRLRFWPLFSYSKLTRDGTEDVDWILFPILFGGHSSTGENYFAFFPLGGRVRNFISYDSFSFVLWPIYQRLVKKIDDQSRAWTSLLLLFGWTEGGPMDDSFRLLPFYMQSCWKGRYHKYSVLWPFFHYQELGLDTKHPAKAYGFWPLMHLEWSQRYYRYGFIGPFLFLGPLVQLAREVPETWQGGRNVERRSYYLYDLPWPLVHLEKTRTSERQRFFPFYSHYHERDGRADFDSKAFLIPFFWLRRTQTKDYYKSDFFLVPFVTGIHKGYRETGRADSYFQLWPLFHCEKTAGGGKGCAFLSLLPSRLTTAFEPVDRLFSPFWTLYRYDRETSGAVRHKALFHLISAYHDRGESRFSIPLLYNYLNIGGRGWRHAVLWKLFTLEGDEEGLKSAKFFFIPVISTAKWSLFPHSSKTPMR